jgi:hypothetical protein
VSLVVATEPASLQSVADQCAAVEAWAETVNDVSAVQDALNKMAAIDEYLSRTSRDGRARVAATMRHLEARIGALLPPPPTPQESGARKGDITIQPSDLSPQQRGQFRKMAAHPEIVDEVIAGSTDDAPASRRKVLNAIDDAKRETGLDVIGKLKHESMKAKRDERFATVERMSAEGSTSRQIAAHLGITTVGLADWRKRHGVPAPPADAVVGKTHRHDSNRIVRESVSTLEGVVLGLGLADLADLDPALIDDWATSLSDSLRLLNRFHKQLKEMTQ